MRFFQGTNLINDAINLTKSRNRVNFGKGFNLTDKKEAGFSNFYAYRAKLYLYSPKKLLFVDKIIIKQWKYSIIL